MARVIVSGDTKVIDKKGNTRFFSDTLINNAQFMKDGGWEIFDSPDVPDAPTFGMDDDAAKLEAEKKAEADAKAAEEIKSSGASAEGAKEPGESTPAAETIVPEKSLADNADNSNTAKSTKEKSTKK